MDRKAELEIQLVNSEIEILENMFAAIKEELQDNVGQLLNSIKLILAMNQMTLVY